MGRGCFWGVSATQYLWKVFMRVGASVLHGAHKGALLSGLGHFAVGQVGCRHKAGREQFSC